MMRSMTLSELRPVLNADLSGADLAFTRVSTDTRNLRQGDLFLALRGENFDGHRFIDEAVAKGAVAVVAEECGQTTVPVLKVADTLRALGQIASVNRLRFAGPVIAVTGSNGKTTVKELLRRVLLQQGPVLATQGNLNNAIGAPLTLLQLAPEHKAAVIELGASGPGEIAWTAGLAAPKVSILTNAGEAHMAGFGSYKGLVEAKGEIISETAREGVVVLNLDDPAFETWKALAGGRTVVSVSAQGNQEADIYARNIVESAAGLVFEACQRGGAAFSISLRLAGVHNVGNALLAVAATRAIGVEATVIKAGLAATDPVKGRMQVLSLGPTITVIDDSYNANPTAMRAALKTLGERGGNRVAVLGDMAELGGDEAFQHQEIGSLARKLGLDYLYVTGRYAEDYARGFGEGCKIATSHSRLFDMLDNELFGSASTSAGLQGADKERVTLLVKGSRSARMDQIVALLNEKVKA